MAPLAASSSEMVPNVLTQRPANALLFGAAAIAVRSLMRCSMRARAVSR